MVHLSQGQEVLGSSDHFILQRTGLLQDLRLLPTISHHFPSPRPSCPPGAWNLCVCVCVCACACTRARAHMLAQLCATLCNPMDCDLPDSFVYCHFLLQEISTQGSNTRLQSLLHWQTNSSLLYHLGSPILEG